MKGSELEKKLKKLGLYIIRQGKKHTLWTFDGKNEIAVPRHNGKEVATGTALRILKDAADQTAMTSKDVNHATKS